MNEEKAKHGLLRQWLEKADNDLISARRLLTLEENCPLDSVCFHAQQCVEKYIKALLTHGGIDFPKIHDLSELVALLPEGIHVPLAHEEESRLTDYATVLRYPGDWEPITRDEAEQAVAVVERVREAVRVHLPAGVLGEEGRG